MSRRRLYAEHGLFGLGNAAGWAGGARTGGGHCEERDGTRRTSWCLRLLIASDWVCRTMYLGLF